MINSMRLVAGAVAIVALVGIGIIVLRPTSNFGGDPPPTPAPSASAAASVAGQPILGSGPLEPGTYHILRGPATPVSFSFTVPAGWIGGGAGAGKHPDESGRELGFGASIIDEVFADPCGANLPIDAGATAQNLADALTGLPGLDVSPPEPISIDGEEGIALDLAVAEGIDVETCDPPIGLQGWIDRAGDYGVIGEGVSTRLYLADVGGERFVLVSNAADAADPNDLAELATIIESIRFER